MATVFKRGGNGNRGGRWYFAYFDHRGQRQVRSARTTDKAAAERIAAKHTELAGISESGDHVALTRLTQELRALEDEVAATETRWLELSEMLE